MPQHTGDRSQRLLAAVVRLRQALGPATLPLDVPGVAVARAVRAKLVAQLDDYVIPRLESLDAPLLAVVGGSTGAGKSTLVNSIVGREVTQPGVLRPTTRSPVLLCHPADTGWFSGPRVLPGLARVTGEASDVSSPGSVRLVPTDAVSPGLALLDAPDIDSVVTANRDLAGQLLAAADLWIFVTTAARYADAVPWDLLREASERGTSIAVVLDRAPADVVGDIRDHLAGMLDEQGLAGAPLFPVVESKLVDGLLPADQTQPLRDWLGTLSADAAARSAVIRQTLQGALESIDDRAAALAAASAEQESAAAALLEAARTAYDDAVGQVRDGVQDGSLLRGEVLARWQEFVGTGELFRQVESTVSRVRDRVTSFLRGEPPPAQNLGEALQTGVEALLSNRAELAAAATARSWRSLPGGAELLERHPDLGRSSSDLDSRIERIVRDWQGEILQMVRDEGKDRRATARVLAYGVNGLGVVLMLVTFASTAGLTGAEVGIAGGTAVLGQKLLEAVFGDQAVRELARKARARLLELVTEAYAAERDRFESVVSAAQAPPGQRAAIDEAAAAVQAAR